MSKTKAVKVTKENLISDILELNKQYQEQNSTIGYINRDFYRANSKFKEKDFVGIFGSFEELKKAAFGEELDIINYKKKIHVLTEKNSLLEKENADLIKSSVIEDQIIDVYEERLNKGIFLSGKENISISKKEKAPKNREAILMLSDFHLGETVISEEMHGINEYNSDIMMQRIDRIFHYFVYYCKKYDIKVVNLLLLGDLLSGCHHDELKKTNEFDDVTCMFFLQEYLMNKIIGIEKEFSEIKIEVLVGNHSRIPEGKPEFKKSAILNYEYILAKQMKMAFDLIQKENKEKKVSVNVSPSLFNVIDVAGRRFLITHGHALTSGSNSFAGIPYYGLAMSASKLDGALKQFEHLQFSDICMGHLHSTSVVRSPFGNIYLNGSVVGVSEYALYKMKVSGTCEQTMLIVEDGLVNANLTLRGE